MIVRPISALARHIKSTGGFQDKVRSERTARSSLALRYL